MPEASIFLEKMHEFSKTATLLDKEDSAMAFFLWEDLDKERAQNYIRTVFTDPIRKLKYICTLAGRWSGGNGSGWSFTHSNYSEYATAEEIYKAIQELDKARIAEFDEVELVKLASFYLNYNKDEFMYVTDQKAMKLVEQWKEN